MSSSSSSELCRSDVGIRLFGVELLPRPPAAAAPASVAAAMRKSVSLGNLMLCKEHLDSADGYQSDGLVHSSAGARARRKGVPWSEDEHRAFLLGLQKLGKGDWRGISRNYVKTRTPTQVASHAQKYFIRQNNLSKKKRRSSLFDISPEHVSVARLCSQKAPVLQLSLSQEPALEDKGYRQEQSRILAKPEAQPPVVTAPRETSSAAFSLNLVSEQRELNVSSSKLASEEARLTLGLALEPSFWTINQQQPVNHSSASACHVNPSFGGLGFVSSIQCT